MDGRQIQRALEDLSFSPNEARAYETLVTLGSLSAKEVAEAIGATRSGAYQALKALADQGLVEAGAGYSSRFRAVEPEIALPALIDHRRVALSDELSVQESLAKEVIEALVQRAADPKDSPGEIFEIIRNPRAVAERFVRLELEAQRSVDMFVRPPFAANTGNPGQPSAIRRGLRFRSLYQPDALEDPAVVPYLNEWIEEGEEARITKDELPFKLALFDGEVALLPLETPVGVHPFTAILIRHHALGLGLARLFDYIWRDSTPLSLDETRSEPVPPEGLAPRTGLPDAG